MTDAWKGPSVGAVMIRILALHARMLRLKAAEQTASVRAMALLLEKLRG